MNRLFWYIKSYLRLKIRGASCERLLERLAKKQIAFWNIRREDALTVEICVFPKYKTQLSSLVSSLQCEIVAEEKVGVVHDLMHLFQRPILIVGVIGGLIAVLWAQNYLLFFEVTGNVNVAEEQILQSLEELGIGVGTYGPDVKPKWIKDHLLNTLTQLQWITVNQNGSIAQIIVRERPEKPEIIRRKGYANIVAGHAGIITYQSVLEGQALKKVGDTVVEGEMLVSGVVDHEIKYSVVYAKAEIYARTWRSVEALIPKKYYEKQRVNDEDVSVWLEIGKRRIKIFGNSGISYTSCDKMIVRINLTLPGQRELPVSLLIERYASNTLSEKAMQEQQAQWILQTFTSDAVSGQLSAGTIVSERSELDEQKDVYRLKTVYECHEMIARTAEGKWSNEDFK